jgi:hypothetical protein
MEGNEIPLTRGRVAIVDSEDYERLSRLKWRLSAYGYAVTSLPREKGSRRQKEVKMHRLIMGLSASDSLVVDHKDTDKLNNRRSNLRACERSKNTLNVGLRTDNRSGFKGVTLKWSTGRWGARIKLDGKTKHLGHYASPEEAHEVYCLIADMLHGEYANHGTAQSISERV